MSKIGLLQSPESISITATNHIQLTAEHYIAVCVRCSPRKPVQRQTRSLHKTLLTNEYRRVGKRIQIQTFYLKFKFSNFV